MSYNQVTRVGGYDVKEIDKAFKNKFKWNWLEEKDSNGMYLSEWVRKIDLPGKALCLLCNTVLRYGGQGKSAFASHAKNTDHVGMISALVRSTTLPATHTAHMNTESECSLPYGAPPNIHNDAVCSSRTEVALPKIPSFMDRLAHHEAFVVSFISEYNLPFSMAPRLLDFARFMAKDSKVLERMKMDRTTASYKLTDGLGPVISQKIIESLRSSFFSFNVDECFSNNHKKIFSMLVSYFSENDGEVLVQHYKSQELDKLNAENLRNFVINSLQEDDIPLNNVVSNLSDSTNYMRGKKAGFETLLREQISHLLDIDGDICHHAHNTTGVFLKPFGKVVEKLCSDVHTDMMYSTDMRAFLVDLCEILSIPYHMPPAYVEHRWLSVLTAADINAEVIDALTLIYYAWVGKDLTSVYKEDVDKLISSSTDRSKERVGEIQKQCSKKKLTEKGLARKERVVVKLFDERNTTDLHLSFYTHILPLIKSFVLVFELKEPMVHRVFEELKTCMQTFLCCFIKCEHVVHLTAKKLTNLDVTDKKLHKSFSDWNIGSKCFKILKKISPEEKEVFKKAVFTAFTTAAVYMQKKFPINNKVLKLLATLDPKCHGVEVTVTAMKKLSLYFPNVISSEEKDAYDGDVTKFHLATDLPPIFKDDGTHVRLDHWWVGVFKMHKLEHLEKLVKAALSIVVGPRVEQSFTGMNSTITSSTNRLKTETFSALQTVKMDLIASKQTSSQRYYRKNFLKSPISPWISRGLQSANKARTQRYVSGRKRAAERRVDLGLKDEPAVKKKKKASYHKRAEKVLAKAYNSKMRKTGEK